ncbi:DUF4913 domain-containing protein [Frankia sp. Mgl5]|uniref:DUF4913 domain-containing protein n=1 Tax=Frankia sp. Mgl5 TaxID=2933793 RepID=UPI00200BE9E4|nr:DUF4913 domain-containing protein [Frankia sp. Mgl5]MCK9931055.1 DUF4913 domain-containing protein [Frankia sp. Mgl5]
MTDDDLVVRLAAVERTLADHDAALTAAATNGAAPDSGDTDEGDDPPQLCYPDLESFVAEFLAVMFPRPLGGEFRWCPWWWDHGEAVLRLESLWRAFESLRLDGEFGIATWLRDHFDHQWPRLLSPSGPFARCSPDRTSRPHEPDPILRVVPPPDGWPNNDD